MSSTKPKSPQKAYPCRTEQRRRRRELPRRDRARGAAASRQARHDAPAIGAGLGNVGALSGADRERRRQSVGERAARHRAARSACRPPALLPASRARVRRARRDASTCSAQVPEGELPALANDDRGARRARRKRRPRPAHRARRPARRRQIGARRGQLAERLTCPFIELDKMIESDRGAPAWRC